MSKSDLTIVRARLSNWGAVYRDRGVLHTSSLYSIIRQGVEPNDAESRSPWSESIDMVDAKVVDAAILKLPLEDKKLLIDIYVKRVTIKRISNILRQFPSTVRKRVEDAETRLSALLDKSTINEYDAL